MMKITIDISESIYNASKMMKDYDCNVVQLPLWVIANGTPLEQEPCGDAISREPFTDSTICEGFSCNECSFNRKDKGGCILEERVKALPSVTPQQRIGHWIEREGKIKFFECDQCHHTEEYATNYCLNCWAKMSVSEDVS